MTFQNRTIYFSAELWRSVYPDIYGSPHQFMLDYDQYEGLITFCETWHDITQNWCIKGGCKIAGIFPGNFIRWNGDHQEYRGCEVHFYQFVGEGEKYATKPEECDLAFKVKEVWKALKRVN